MLPGNMQYWRPENNRGVKEIDVDEPVHFAGPPPETQLNSATDYPSTQQEEVKKREQPHIPQPDPQGAAQQTSQVMKPIDEETKEPEPSQTVKPAGRSAMDFISADGLSKVKKQPIEPVQQSADLNQATLLAFQSILAQQLREQREEQEKHQEKLQKKLQKKLQEKHQEQLREQKEQLESRLSQQ